MQILQKLMHRPSASLRTAIPTEYEMAAARRIRLRVVIELRAVTGIVTDARPCSVTHSATKHNYSCIGH